LAWFPIWERGRFAVIDYTPIFRGQGLRAKIFHPVEEMLIPFDAKPPVLV